MQHCNVPSKRRACDKCHRQKEKCNFGMNPESCIRCVTSGLPCTTLRSHLRQGRRPKGTPLGPNHSVQIWDIANTSVLVYPTHSPIWSHITIPSTTADGTERSNLKRCSPSLSEIQARCAADLLESSPELVDRFSATYSLLMLGPSFASRFRAAIQRSYIWSPDLLQDIYTIILPTVERATERTQFCGETDIAKGSTSLQKLRITTIARIEDAFAIIALGQTLALFELLTNCVGSISILRYSLSSIRPWYKEMSTDPSCDPVTIGPILWNTVFGLIKREVPVIKFITRDPQVVDHVAGLCTTLLPIFYDLCVASNTLKSQVQSRSQIESEDLREIERRISTWTPEIPSNFYSAFTNMETSAMLTQASMYQMAGLLMVHRILNPIGIRDDVAISYANSILLEFSRYSASVGQHARLPFVTFPILIAALEIAHVPKEIWDSIKLLSAAPDCASQISGAVEYVWVRRNSGFAGCIFDLLDNGPSFTIIP